MKRNRRRIRVRNDIGDIHERKRGLVARGRGQGGAGGDGLLRRLETRESEASCAFAGVEEKQNGRCV